MARHLSVVAAKLHSPRLATLVYQIRHDAFTHVKKAVDDMIAVLLKEKDYEIKHKDFCTQEFNQNQLLTENKGREKCDLIGKSEDLKISINTPAEEFHGKKLKSTT